LFACSFPRYNFITRFPFIKISFELKYFKELDIEKKGGWEGVFIPRYVSAEWKVSVICVSVGSFLVFPIFVEKYCAVIPACIHEPNHSPLINGGEIIIMPWVYVE
jgi:hypothetical protein